MLFDAYDGRIVVARHTFATRLIVFSSYPMRSAALCCPRLFDTELPHNSLRSVAIRNNDVRSVDDETFSGLQLEKLALDGNQLSVISDSGFRYEQY